MSIGIFDSGIGGVTLLHQAMITLPQEKYIFYADVDHVPYGTKSSQQVLGFVDEVMQFMIQHNCKAVVIACNTATSVAAEEMRRKYSIPIIGIEPAVKPAVQESGGRRVLVVATPLAVQEKKLKNLVKRVDESHLVDMLALPKLVEFAERGEFASEMARQYLEELLSSYDLDKYGELVLGCTHFNYFKDTFRKLLPDQVKILDGSAGTIRQLARVLGERGALEEAPPCKMDNTPAVQYFLSGRELVNPEDLERMQRLHQRLEEMRHIL